MGFAIGDVVLVAMPVAILVAVIWALSAAFKPSDSGLSDAERYQRELAARSAAHHAAQVQAATAARARIDASTKPSQNAQQHSQQQNQQRPASRRQETHSDLSTAKNYIDRL